MAKKKPSTDHEEMTLKDAVDNLSNIAELDLSTSNQGVKGQLHSFSKLNKKDQEKTLETVKGTFKTVHKYLERVYQKDVQDVEVQKGVKAMMLLAGEAAEKIDKCTSLFQYTHQEYKDLKNFYMSKIAKRFQDVLAKEDTWEEEWQVEDIYLNIEKLGIKDLETVKRDREYELFHVRQDDGKPFFNRNLIRHIKLVSDFDEMLEAANEVDPFLQITVLLDRETQSMAEEIKAQVEEYLDDFYVDAMQYKDIPVVNETNRLVMSMMLAASPKNLLQNNAGKATLRYLRDFHAFLRSVLSTQEYLRLTARTTEEIDHISKALVQLVDACAYAFIKRKAKWQIWQPFIRELIKKSYEGTPPTWGESKDILSLLSDLLDDHERVTKMLRKFPNGPLFKTMDAFRSRGEPEGFDPLLHGNYPESLYAISTDKADIQCLRLPCPTIHKRTNEAVIAPEFLGFLRFLNVKEPTSKYLMINLQDRTSWAEHARCEMLEKAQKRAEYSSQFSLLTLPTKTAFYNQSNDYSDLNQAGEFFKTLIEQIKSGEECGFYFSHQFKKKPFMTFIEEVIPVIHSSFFEGKKTLNRNERLDFIEIFYLLLSLKAIEVSSPDIFSFTCKDGIDTSQTMTAGLYVCIQLFKGNMQWEQEMRDHFLWLLFAPALKVRERLIDFHYLSRSVSALSRFAVSMEGNRGGITKSLLPHFSGWLDKLDCQ